jgi:hypothetical protein
MSEITNLYEIIDDDDDDFGEEAIAIYCLYDTGSPITDIYKALVYN